MERPKIVCLCGSTRFMDTFKAVESQESLAGKIVLSICCNLKEDNDMPAGYTPEAVAAIKERFNNLRLKTIEMADEILVLNVGGYVGESTKKEISYARSLGRRIRWLEHDVPLWKKILNKARRKLEL